MRTETGTLIQALKILAEDVRSVDGVANAAILEGAHRIEELVKELEAVKANMGILEIYHKNINQIKADAILDARQYCINNYPYNAIHSLTEYANSLINNKEG